jgi:ABC-2 type transport system permease protein
VKALSIARKSLLELMREPLLLGLLLLFPVILVLFYKFAFGETEGGLASYLNILVVNEDVGASVGEGEFWLAGDTLIDALQSLEYDEEAVFNLRTVSSRSEAEITLREHKAALLLAIPEDFSQTLVDVSLGSGQAPPAEVLLVGDPGADNFVFARGFMEGLIRQFAQDTMGWGQATLEISYEFIPGTGTMSDFDFGVGGIIVFGIMFLVITTATVLVRENVTGTLQRLRLSTVRAFDLLVGVTLAQMIVAAIQVPITFGTAILFGFQSNGSLLLAIGIGLLLSLGAVGVGLVVACFARDDGEATNLASGVLVPMVFLSGALYPMPEFNLVTVAGRTIQVYDLLPATHASEALRRVLIFGEGMSEIAYELGGLTFLSVALLALGVVLYQRLKMTN